MAEASLAPKRRRFPEQKRAVAAFVQRLFLLSGADSQSAFADLAHVNEVNFSKWQSGKAVPDGWNLLQMLSGLQACAEEASREITLTDLVGDARPVVVARRESLAERLDRVESALTRAGLLESASEAVTGLESATEALGEQPPLSHAQEEAEP